MDHDLCCREGNATPYFLWLFLFFDLANFEGFLNFVLHFFVFFFASFVVFFERPFGPQKVRRSGRLASSGRPRQACPVTEAQLQAFQGEVERIVAQVSGGGCTGLASASPGPPERDEQEDEGERVDACGQPHGKP